MFNFNNKNSFFGIDYDDFFKPSKTEKTSLPPPQIPPPPAPAPLPVPTAKKKKRSRTKTTLTDEEAERMYKEVEARNKAKRQERFAKRQRLNEASELMVKFEARYPGVLTDEMLDNFYHIVKNNYSDAPLSVILRACIAAGKRKD